jgi:hypothetical protein
MVPYHEAKSIGTENTFESDTIDINFLLRELVRMTEKIAFKLRTEIRPKLNPADFNIKSIFKRLEKKGDLWEGLNDQNIKEKNTSILTKLL